MLIVFLLLLLWMLVQQILGRRPNSRNFRVGLIVVANIRLLTTTVALLLAGNCPTFFNSILYFVKSVRSVDDSISHKMMIKYRFVGRHLR